MSKRVLFAGASNIGNHPYTFLPVIEKFRPIEQELCLSVLGLDVWRTYREQHIPSSLLLPLHIGTDNFPRFMAGAAEVLAALPRTSRYPDITTLAAAVNAGITALPDRVFRVTAESYYNGLPVAELAAAYGVPTDDVRIQRVGSLGTFVLTCMDPTFRHYDAVSMGAWLRVWLDICDAVLTVNPVVVADEMIA